MTVRQQLIAKTKKKRCIYCGKWRLIGELDRIDYGAFQCPEHDLESINSVKRSATSNDFKWE